MSEETFTQRAIEVIRAIPEGQVCTYGGVAALAGNHRAARQVVRVLHTSSSKENLPWHRVINKQGKIGLKQVQGFERQKDLLKSEGVPVSEDGHIDLESFLWRPLEKKG